MEKYITTFSFEVMDDIKAGKTVYVLDKKYYTVYCVNDMKVQEFAEILKTEDTGGRFVYWYTVDEGETDA